MQTEEWTIGRLLAWSQSYLERQGDEHPLLSAQWLLGHACDLTRMDLYTHFDQPTTAKQRALFKEGLKRRAQGEPLQYITGSAPFRFITLKVGRGGLIPRPETEVLVSEFLAKMPDDDTACTVVDVCAGSGCIALSLALERPSWNVYATELSPDAFELAEANRVSHGLEESLCLLKGDLLAPLEGVLDVKLDGIIANPPYIPTEVLGAIDKEVSDYEPRIALDGGSDGLAVFRRLLEQATVALGSGGVFAVELFETTLDEAARMAGDAGLIDVEIKCDLAGKKRILLARKP